MFLLNMSCQKYISLEDQNNFAYKFFDLVATLSSYLISKDDMLSMHYAHKILTSNKYFEQIMTRYLSKANATRTIQLCFNLGVIAVQWVVPMTSSWTSYMFLSKSGLSIVMNSILNNPLFGSIFFLSFYYRLLGTQDITTFNIISSFYGLPSYQQVSSSLYSSSYIDSIINRVSEVFSTKIKDKNKVRQLVIVGASQILTTTHMTAGKYLVSTMEKSTAKIMEMKPVAIFSSERNSLCFDSSEIDKHLNWLIANKSSIKKMIKNKSATKKEYKKNLATLKTIKSHDGEIMCLDDCRLRRRTRMGCYCDSKCDKTRILGVGKGVEWCWVDKDKCKNGKFLPKYLGRTYDFCEDKMDSQVCFNGVKYVGCLIK